MKKKYIMPHTKVVKIKFESLLAADSIKDTDGNADIHSEDGSSEEPNSLEVSFE